MEADVRLYLETREGNSKLTQEELENVRDELKFIDDQCERIWLKRALEKLAHLRNMFVELDQGTLKLDNELTLDRLSWELEGVRNAIYYDLNERLFLYVPAQFAKYHYDSLSVYGKRELYGKEVVENFPNAVKEMRAAGNCYATGNNTACVFHLMRATEYGLRAVFKRYKVTYSRKPKTPVEFLQWGEIISAIQGKIDGLEKTKKTKRRDDDIEFLRGVAVQFKYFKDKWRNNVMHSREFYEVEDATKTMRQVQDFMEHLAARVKESEK